MLEVFVRYRLLVIIFIAIALVPGAVRAQDDSGSPGNFLLRVGADVTIDESQRVGTVVVVNGDLTVDGSAESVFVVDGDVVVNGSVVGDISVLQGRLTLSESAIVGGNLSLGNAPLTRAPGAAVEGTINDDAFGTITNWKSRSVHARIWTSLTIFFLVVGLILARVSGDQIEKAGNNLVQRPLVTLGSGFLALIALPIAGLLMLSTIYLLPLGGLLLVTAPALWIFGYIFTGIMVGRIVLLRTSSLLPGEAYNPYAAAIVGILILQLIVLIPLADVLVAFVAVTIGSGSMLVSAFSERQRAEPDVTMTRDEPESRVVPALPTGRRRVVARLLIIWLANTFALLLIAGLTSMISFSGASAAFVLAAVIGIFNALIRPLILRITLPLTVLTLGLFVLYIDAVLLRLAEFVIPGVSVESLPEAIATAFLLTLINLAVGGLLAINDDDSFYRYTLRRSARRGRDGAVESDKSLIIIEIDGLSDPALKQAMNLGYAPTLKRWVERGSHTLTEFDCGLPAQTSACQAGILYGDNFDIPAFRWYEKDTGTLMVSNNPRQSVELDARLSSRSDGLLHPNGVSIGNLVTGGAREAPLTMGAIKTRPRAFAREQSALYFYFLGPYNFTRTILLGIWEIMLERWESFQQGRRNVQPRIHRHWPYVLERAVSSVMLRDLETAIVLRDIHAGVPISYAMFVGYDVVAHHAGPYTDDAFKVLQKIDNRIGMLERASYNAQGDISFVILSDHGQSTGETFLQRYGESLEEVVNRLTNRSLDVEASTAGENEGFNQFNAMLSGLIAGENVQGRAARAVLRGQTSDGYVDVTPESLKGDADIAESEIIVMASGNLGLVYLTHIPGRADLDDIETAYPGLVGGLVNHDGIAFIMVASRERGAVIIGKRGTYLLDEDRFEGEENPLAGYGPRAAAHFRRLDSFPHVADIMLNSVFDPQSGHAPAFEELVGSHGGIGGDQTRPFLLYPEAWTPAVASIDSANDVYTVLDAWKSNLLTEAPAK